MFAKTQKVWIGTFFIALKEKMIFRRLHLFFKQLWFHGFKWVLNLWKILTTLQNTAKGIWLIFKPGSWQLTMSPKASIGSAAMKIRNPGNTAHSGFENGFFYIIYELSIEKFLRFIQFRTLTHSSAVSGVIVKNLNLFRHTRVRF